MPWPPRCGIWPRHGGYLVATTSSMRMRKLDDGGLNGLANLGGRDPEVRGVPHRAAVAHEDGLRRFVTNAEACGNGVGDIAMRLNGHDCVTDAARLLLDVCTHLVQRFCGDATRIAVLEEKQRTHARFRQHAFELVDSRDRRQVTFHIRDRSRRTKRLFSCRAAATFIRGVVTATCAAGFRARS